MMFRLRTFYTVKYFLELMRHKIEVNITLHPFIIITWYLTKLCSLPKTAEKLPSTGVPAQA